MKMKTTLFLLMSAACFQALATNGIPFWAERFATGFPAAWTTSDASNQNVMWEHCNDPKNCPPAIFAYLSCRDAEFRSNSFENGYVFVNSFKHGTLPSPHAATLRTNSIDCGNKSAVFLQFNTYIHAQVINPDTGAVVRVRAGNGPWVSFTVFPNLNEAKAQNLQSWNPQPVLLDISAVAANQPAVQIEWRWTGNFEIAWMLDDIALFNENPLFENAVWGTTPGQGDFNGGLNGWSVTNQLDTCRWRWNTDGLVDYPDQDLLANALGCSPTLTNGVMTMNASFCQGPYGSSSFFSRSDLKSPVIDLSAVPPFTRLALKFYQTVALANPESAALPLTSVAVSIDNGATFIDTLDANPLLPFQVGFCGETTLDLPLAVAGASQVRLVFIFAGDSFFWTVDDVRIVRQHEYDVRINPLFYSVSPEAVMPSGLVSPIAFSAEVENRGNSSLHGVTAFAVVKNNETGQEVFRDTLLIGELQAGETAFGGQFFKKFTPPAVNASYTCYYRVAAGEPDQDSLDNVVRWGFSVSDSTFSKTLNLCSVNGYFAPSESLTYEIGNCYYVPAGSNVAATSMSFAFRNAQPLGAAGATLQTALYRWKTDLTNGDANVDTLANQTEYELVAINSYDVKGNENNKLITVPIDYENGAVNLESDTWYFVTVGYTNPVYYLGNPVPFGIGASEEVNYTSMFWLSYQQDLPRYVSMLRLGNDTYFRANGWALQRIPFVQLNVKSLTETVEQPENQVKMSVWPNPAREIVWLNADFDRIQRWVRVEIFDLWGRLVKTLPFENTYVSQLAIDVSGLSNGSYTLRVLSESWAGSARLQVLKD